MAECSVHFDYLFVHDVVAATSETGTSSEVSGVEAGWIYEVRVLNDSVDGPSYLLRGAGEVDLPVTVAVAIRRAADFASPVAVANAVHKVQGSATHFDALFADSFSLAAGSTELLAELDLFGLPFRAYTLQNPSDRVDPTPSASR